MTEMAQSFTKDTVMPSGRTLLNVDILGPYLGHVLAILVPCFDNFYNIVASRCWKWLKFSLEGHVSQIEEYHSMSNYWDHIRAMLGQY